MLKKGRSDRGRVKLNFNLECYNKDRNSLVSEIKENKDRLGIKGEIKRIYVGKDFVTVTSSIMTKLGCRLTIKQRFHIEYGVRP